MKLTISTAVIYKLNPCVSRFDNWKQHYDQQTLCFTEFIKLDKITHSDKLWVLLRLVPQDIRTAFARDCASRAATYANAACVEQKELNLIFAVEVLNA